MSQSTDTSHTEFRESTGGVRLPIRMPKSWLIVCLAAFVFPWSATAEEDVGWKVGGSFGHIAFQALGRESGITPLELFPHLMTEDQIIFGDFRTFVTNDGRLGGNYGAGWRFIEPTESAMFGVSGWYDIDNSTGTTFHQLGLNLEARMSWAGLGMNLYLPVGDQNQILNRQLSNVRFHEHQILFDVASESGESMPGMDVTFSAYVPIDYLVDHQVQASCGWYHFQGKTRDDIDGFKLQLDGNIVPSVSAQVAVTHDATFGTNTTLGLSWRFGAGGIPEPDDLKSQLKRFVDRNYNVIVSKQGESLSNVAAINAASNEAYVIQHVGAGIGDDTGAAGDPWQQISQAQLAGGDVLFVHANTTLSESIVLNDGQYLFGEGVAHELADAHYGTFTLPTVTTETTLPRLLNSPGTALTLASNTVVSGIRIEQAGGDGISGIGVDNVTLIDLRINGANGNGLMLDGVTNTQILGSTEIQNVDGDGIRVAHIDEVIEFGDTTISDVGAAGINVVSGHGEITFSGKTRIDNAAGSGFQITDLETVTETNDDDEEVDVVGTVTVEELAIVGAVGSTGITVVDSDGVVTFNDVDLQTTNGAALYFRNAANVWISDGTLNSTDAPVADLEDSSFGIALESLYANGGPQGLRIVNSEGNFFVYGDGATDDEDAVEGTGGLIQNTDVALVLEGAGSTGMQYVNFKSNGMVAKATNSDSLEIDLSKINGTTESIVDATNLTSLSITKSHFEDNSMTSGYGVRFKVNTTGSFVTTISDNVVVDNQGTFFIASALSGGETATLTTSFLSNDITLSTAGDVAARIDWSGTSQAALSSNQISGDAVSQTAFVLNFADTTNLIEVGIHSNAIVFNEANSVAVQLNSQSPTTLSVQQNQIAFNERDGIGFNLTLGRVSDVTVSGNSIFDYGGGATAVRFPSVYDGTIITLDSNLIDLSKVDGFVDQGIILSAVTGDDDPFVTLNSSISNTITGASTSYYFPASGVNGQLIVNENVIQ
jgi:hypothetical protein